MTNQIIELAAELIINQLNDLYKALVANIVTRKDAVTRFDDIHRFYTRTVGGALSYNEYFKLNFSISDIYLKCSSLISEKWGDLNEIISEINYTDIVVSDIRITKTSSESYQIFDKRTGIVLFNEILDLDKYTGRELYEHILTTVLNYI